MRISEVTLRKIISDYVHKRQQFKGRMVWVSQYTKEKIIIDLEQKPFTQESIGYKLLKEDEDVEMEKDKNVEMEKDKNVEMEKDK